MSKKPQFNPTEFFDIDPPANQSSKLSNYCKGKATVVLKESATKLSCPFQHMAEMVEVHGDRKEAFMLLQGDSGFNCNCATPRSIIATVILFIKLKLEQIACIRNAPGYSIFHPTKRAMSAINFSLQPLAFEREPCSP